MGEYLAAFSHAGKEAALKTLASRACYSQYVLTWVGSEDIPQEKFSAIELNVGLSADKKKKCKSQAD